jgi:mRNA interferase RelE/StbE
VKSLAGSNAKRLRVGDFRVIFEEGATEIVVSRIGPRGGVYD